MNRSRWILKVLVSGIVVMGILTGCSQNAAKIDESYADLHYGEIATKPEEAKDTAEGTDATEAEMTAAITDATAAASLDGMKTVPLYPAGLNIPIPEDWILLKSDSLSTLFCNPDHTQYMSVSYISDLWSSYFDENVVLSQLLTIDPAPLRMEIEGEVRPGYRVTEDAGDLTLPSYYGSRYSNPLYDYGECILSDNIYTKADGSDSDTIKSLTFLFPKGQMSNTLYYFSFVNTAGELTDMYDMAYAITQNVSAIPETGYGIADVAMAQHSDGKYAFSYPSDLTEVKEYSIPRIANDELSATDKLFGVRIGLTDPCVSVDKVKELAGKILLMVLSGTNVPNVENIASETLVNYPEKTSIIYGDGEEVAAGTTSFMKYNFSVVTDFSGDKYAFNPGFWLRQAVYNSNACTLLIYGSEGSYQGIIVTCPQESEVLQKALVQNVIDSFQVIG